MWNFFIVCMEIHTSMCEQPEVKQASFTLNVGSCGNFANIEMIAGISSVIIVVNYNRLASDLPSWFLRHR
jgi:hypothetical protein